MTVTELVELSASSERQGILTALQQEISRIQEAAQRLAGEE